MPTYDYRCTECGHTLEAFQSITAPALTECPACAASTLVRGVGGGLAIHFQGSGFYLTDYKKPCQPHCPCHPKETPSP